MSYSKIAMNYSNFDVNRSGSRHPNSPLTTTAVHDQFKAAGFEPVYGDSKIIRYGSQRESLLVDKISGIYGVNSGDVTIFAFKKGETTLEDKTVVVSSKSPLVALVGVEFELTQTVLEGFGYCIWTVRSHLLTRQANPLNIHGRLTCDF